MGSDNLIRNSGRAECHLARSDLFRDANAESILARLYRSTVIGANNFGNGTFPLNTWVDLPAAHNQYDPEYVRHHQHQSGRSLPRRVLISCAYQACLLQGDAAKSPGSMYFDDQKLNLISSAPYGDWNIVWNDEFNGTNINTNTWTYDLGGGGWG